MDWNIFAWLKRGKRRIDILKILGETTVPLSKNEISKKLKIALPQVSLVINELVKKNLVECLNPQDKIGKLFRLASLGKECFELLSRKL